jgi:DNA-nicking Smr family endonuclease
MPPPKTTKNTLNLGKESNRKTMKHKLKKSERITRQDTLDLHCLKKLAGETPEEAVSRTLDKFMLNYILRKTAKITIVVGKGMGSKNYINGKNPLRHYTEMYLEKAGCPWRDGDYSNGQEGVIIVQW